jgi:Holliday junction resolvase RusA-like endonuclease
MRAGRLVSWRAPEVERNSKEIEKLLEPLRPPRPFEGPLRLSAHFVTPLPASWPKCKKTPRWKDTRPDLDNQCKQLLDVMAKANYFQDDSRIASLILVKRWSTCSGDICIFNIRELDNAH